MLKLVKILKAKKTHTVAPFSSIVTLILCVPCLLLLQALSVIKVGLIPETPGNDQKIDFISYNSNITNFTKPQDKLRFEFDTVKFVGSTVTSESGSAEDIQAVIDTIYAAGGGIVHIPEGDFNLGGSVLIRDNVKLIGAGKDKTILRTQGISMVIKAHGDNIRISGFSLISTNYDGGNGIEIDNCVDFRVDNLYIEGYSDQAAVFVSGIDTRGVIDHCEIKMKVVSNLGYGIVVYRDEFWEEDMELGSAQATFIEDNVFVNARHSVAANSGAHYVFRHNLVRQGVVGQQVDAHGPYWGSNEGTRAVEVYDNVIENPSSGSETAMDIRGGGGVIFDNTIRGYDYGVKLVIESGQDLSSYPVYHQVHDLWIWDNISDGLAEVTVSNSNNSTEFIIENRDFFLYAKPGYIPYTYPHPLTSDQMVIVSAPDKVPENTDLTATINVFEVEELNTAQYDIWFEPTILRLDSISDGLIGTTPFPISTEKIDPQEIEPGHWKIVQSLGLSSVSGSGYLAELHFQAIGGPGECSDITLTTGLLKGTAGEISAAWGTDTVCISDRPPEVTTVPYTNLTPASATLHGTLESPGDAASINVSFIWGDISQSDPIQYPNETPGVPATLSESGTFLADLTGLSPGTDYYYRTKAMGNGVAYGEEGHFQTPPIDVIRILPETTTPGSTFNVIINFTAPGNDFIPLIIDIAPEGWQVQVDKNWCDPVAANGNTPKPNQAQYTWLQGYAMSKPMSVVYKVTVPTDAASGAYTFPRGELGYKFSSGAQQHVDITGDVEIIVIDIIPPTVITTAPEDGVIDVLVDTNFEVKFSEPMDRTSVVNAFSIQPQLEGQLNLFDDTMMFVPDNDLDFLTVYIVTINAGAQDQDGNGLDGNSNGISEGSPTDDYIWCLTTIGNTAPTAPVVNVTPGLPTTGDNLICTVTTPSTDANNDTITYTYKWYKDDILQPAEMTTTTGLTDTLLSTLTGTGETWKCVVTPNDGTVDGPTADDWVIIVAAAKTETITDDTVDAIVEADTEIDVDGSATVIVAKYKDNPGTGFSNDIGKYIDVCIEDTTSVNQIEIRLYYTESDIDGLNESLLKLNWWDGSAWLECSDSGVSTDDINGYSGYIWAKIRDDTSPTLDELSGTYFGAATKNQTTNNGGGGSSGGGGGGPPPGLGTLVDKMTPEGKVVRDVRVAAQGVKAYLTILEGTVCLDEHGGILSWIYFELLSDTDPVPASPDNSVLVSRIYELNPHGATFDPPITLSFKYDTSSIPEGMNEDDLIIAYWDENEEQWVFLNCIIDTENKTISTEITHFSRYTVMAKKNPANITVSDVVLQCDEILEGEEVIIDVYLVNAGEETGDHEVVLNVDGEEKETRLVTLEGGETATITFICTGLETGTHQLEVNGTVAEVTVLPEPELSEAKFSLSDLTVSSQEVDPGEEVIIQYTVINEGDLEGTYSFDLRANTDIIEMKEIILSGGASQEITIATSFDTPGKKLIEVADLLKIVIVKGEEPEPEQIPLPLAPELEDTEKSEWSALAPDPTATPKIPIPSPETETSNWWIYCLIAGGCVIALAGLIFVALKLGRNTKD